MNLLQRIFGRRSLEPKDIARKIGKLMDLSKTESVYRIYVPSRFRIALSAEDLDRLSPFQESVTHELVDFIRGHAEDQEYQLLTDPLICLEGRDDLKPGSFEVEAIYQDQFDQVEDDTTDQFNTMVFDRIPDTPGQDSNTTRAFASKLAETPTLEITEGNDQGMKYNLKETAVTLGRKEENQVVLHDPNISRFHAKIFFKEKWQIEDLDSTNGVFVNDKRIKNSELVTGDQIRMGSTLMKFRIK